MTRAIWACFLLTIPSLLLMLLCLGGGAIIAYMVPLHLALGWFLNLLRIVREVEADGLAWLTILVGAAILAAGIHLVARWFHGVAAEQWSPRRSCALAGAFILLALAGICTVGITHQVFWLASAKEHLLHGPATNSQNVNNLKQISLSAHAHHDVHKTLPAGVVFDDHGRMLHGWSVMMLPYLEQDPLFRQIDRRLPWDHRQNHEPFSRVVPTYTNPLADASFSPDGKPLLHYAGNLHLLGSDRTSQLRSVTDGTSNTILLGMVGEDFRPWGYPYHARDPARGLNAGPFTFGNPWPTSSSVAFALADGTVRAVQNDVSPQVLQALSTPAGGEDINSADW